ncbi:MAG: hypothetical protein AAF532_13795 [Planctomycetota bacterium]
MSRPSIRTVFAAATASALVYVTLASTAAAGPIEAIRGKEYRLTTAHGPWMIMVATFNTPPAGSEEAGLTPDQAAAELVFELRKAGLPAYTYKQDEQFVDTTAGDSLGGASPAQYRAKLGEVCVLAGNYKTKAQAGEKPNSVADLDGPCGLAQRSLAWVETFEPAFLSVGEDLGNGFVKLASGGVIRRTEGQPTVLSGAFLTINPLLDPTAVRSRLDPLVTRLNERGRNPYTLADCDGKFSLVVKTFRGSSQIAQGDLPEADGGVQQVSFLRGLFGGGSRGLPELAKLEVEAVALAGALRETKLARELGLPAYAWHEADYSIVTVGAFDDRNDPKIAELAKRLGLKPEIDPASGRRVVTGEFVPDPRGGGRNSGHGWILDPQPTVIEVPQVD